ncbi:hypothetical protein [Aestuariimicrobium kwangyangense]|uniref:hypothetical protein n=1 Tax=Aestuariimicrobium kwangyangense TaxID=396389 RepID=UPI0003B528B4|nr:hypothetical protein [Aestuariimicrobium kwangyangense]
MTNPNQPGDPQPQAWGQPQWAPAPAYHGQPAPPFQTPQHQAPQHQAPQYQPSAWQQAPGWQQPVSAQASPEQAVQGAGQGFVELTVQGNAFTSSMLTPTVTIDGHRITTRYGLNTIPVPAGHHHIDASSQWMRTYGQASLDVTVRPGEHVPVFYASPFHQFTTGSMGHEPQKRKGLGVMLGIVVSLPLVIFVLGLAASLAGS